VKTPWRPFVRVFGRHFRRPFVFAILIGALSLLIVSFLPVWYQATTTLLPPQESQNSFGLLASVIESSALSRVGLITTNSPADVFVEIMKSRRVSEALIKRFDLQKRYHIKNLDRCLKVLDKHVAIDVRSTKILELKVEDKDPEVAADMANTLVEELDQFNRLVNSQRYLRTQQYLEGQLGLVLGRLHDAEVRLADYERRTGIVVQPEATAVSGAAELIARKMDLQVRRSWLQSFSRSDDPAVQSIDTELQAIDREVSKLPGLKQEAARRQLDVEVQRRVYTLITAQIEEARLEGARNLPTVTVLDPARAPLERHRPRRGIVVGITLGVALLLAAIYATLRARRDLEQAGLLLE
jgi:uncharacterized protein involved in exopolysaccharide biosynthesis